MNETCTILTRLTVSELVVLYLMVLSLCVCVYACVCLCKFSELGGTKGLVVFIGSVDRYSN